jgi:hypothetical protein
MEMCASNALAASNEFSFGILSSSLKTNSDESQLRAALKASDADNLAFVVANGIKADTEPCSDELYLRRKALFNSAQNGLILSLSASDWSDCKSSSGRSIAMERLNRIRELFFSDEFSLGASKIPLMHQSISPRFRSYSENMRWEINGMLFATIDLPANNNHYLAAAGRNSEFEDRLIADKAWLQHLLTYAVINKRRGIVLFCDGDPVSSSVERNARRDGFLEIRKQLVLSAAKYSKKILVIHAQPEAVPSAIKWHGDLGELAVAPGWVKVTVRPSSKAQFLINDKPILLSADRQ